MLVFLLVVVAVLVVLLLVSYVSIRILRVIEKHIGMVNLTSG